MQNLFANSVQKDLKEKGDIEFVGYMPNILAFPFAILKKRENDKTYWIIVNRFSHQTFLYRFETKKNAEKFFECFSEIYNINDIEFKDPLSDFKYHIASSKALSLMKQKEYILNNCGKH